METTKTQGTSYESRLYKIPGKDIPPVNYGEFLAGLTDDFAQRIVNASGEKNLRAVQSRNTEELKRSGLAHLPAICIGLEAEIRFTDNRFTLEHPTGSLSLFAANTTYILQPKGLCLGYGSHRNRMLDFANLFEKALSDRLEGIYPPGRPLDDFCLEMVLSGPEYMTKPRLSVTLKQAQTEKPRKMPDCQVELYVHAPELDLEFGREWLEQTNVALRKRYKAVCVHSDSKVRHRGMGFPKEMI